MEKQTRVPALRIDELKEQEERNDTKIREVLGTLLMFTLSANPDYSLVDLGDGYQVYKTGLPQEVHPLPAPENLEELRRQIAPSFRKLRPQIPPLHQ